MRQAAVQVCTDRGQGCPTPSWVGSQLQTYPQANEELLLAARHHAAVVEYGADLLQSFGSEQCGFIAEDVNLSALQPRVRQNTAGLGKGTGAQYECLYGGGGRLGEVRDKKHLLSETSSPANPAPPNHALTGI